MRHFGKSGVLLCKFAVFAHSFLLQVPDLSLFFVFPDFLNLCMMKLLRIYFLVKMIYVCTAFGNTETFILQSARCRSRCFAAQVSVDGSIKLLFKSLTYRDLVPVVLKK